MRSTESQVIARQQQELEYLRVHKHTTVNFLASYLEVSPMTITRDLHMFIKKGLVIHDYGQVVWIGELRDEAKISKVRAVRLIDNIVQRASGYQRVAINASPITEVVIQQLMKQNIEVLTNQLILSPEINAHQLTMTAGGYLNHSGNLYYFSGDIAVHTLRHDTPELAFVYATGMNDNLLTTMTLAQSVVDRTIFESAATTVTFLADNAQNRESNFMIVKRERVSELI
ncbi:hypothetical protein LFAB_15285 [Lactiplantibacillus fabifermentans T30PCM01]|uniref:HTH deoR-type domain-containing protein n=1 Tax=Lactiplantibacillus fabifermentans T30PCM01 TaxID=1400520 RepID=W6TBM3_9LACO|nr:DeoR family transcriptional regulator [Lactiplantibacillus fabifermentans]ETY72890.1 hypothetical protein LFAB_15285 [Lactiplantibacillus fabifermentans T30PCM01]